MDCLRDCDNLNLPLNAFQPNRSISYLVLTNTLHSDMQRYWKVLDADYDAEKEREGKKNVSLIDEDVRNHTSFSRQPLTMVAGQPAAASVAGIDGLPVALATIFPHCRGCFTQSCGEGRFRVVTMGSYAGNFYRVGSCEECCIQSSSSAGQLFGLGRFFPCFVIRGCQSMIRFARVLHLLFKKVHQGLFSSLSRSLTTTSAQLSPYLFCILFVSAAHLWLIHIFLIASFFSC